MWRPCPWQMIWIHAELSFFFFLLLSSAHEFENSSFLILSFIFSVSSVRVCILLRIVWSVFLYPRLHYIIPAKPCMHLWFLALHWQKIFKNLSKLSLFVWQESILHMSPHFHTFCEEIKLNSVTGSIEKKKKQWVHDLRWLLFKALSPDRLSVTHTRPMIGPHCKIEYMTPMEPFTTTPSIWPITLLGLPFVMGNRTCKSILSTVS